MNSVAPYKCAVWRKGNVQLQGSHNRILDKWSYTYIFIGSPQKYAESLPPIYLELFNGEKIFLPSLTVDSLKSRKDIKEYLSGMPAIYIQTSPNIEWPKETKFYQHTKNLANHDVYDIYIFAVIDNNIVGLFAHEDSAGFWNQSLTKRYKFPLLPTSHFITS
jgi:hypothetical protein